MQSARAEAEALRKRAADVETALGYLFSHGNIHCLSVVVCMGVYVFVRYLYPFACA